MMMMMTVAPFPCPSPSPNLLLFHMEILFSLHSGIMKKKFTDLSMRHHVFVNISSKQGKVIAKVVSFLKQLVCLIDMLLRECIANE